jgi:wyosine [tRNA(Phe)-imidazoG37] synthetase (radical SAM superfamily)
MASYSYLFGPVPSRRLGRSLGIDLVPFKTCSLNCLFCQLGESPATTLTRAEYIPLDDVLKEIDIWLRDDGQADILTLSGSGEPTLHNRFGQVLQHIKAVSSLPTALLTNGTLLDRAEVRDAAACADIVKATLSSWDQSSFQRIHRPHNDLSFQNVVNGQRTFAEGFSGRLLVEVFLLPGINDSLEQVRRIAALVQDLQPYRVQLNTAVRPPADDSVRPVPLERLRELATVFEPAAEIIASFRTAEHETESLDPERLLNLLHRRPCTVEDMSAVFNVSPQQIAEPLQSLIQSGQVVPLPEDHYGASPLSTGSVHTPPNKGPEQGDSP